MPRWEAGAVIGGKKEEWHSSVCLLATFSNHLFLAFWTKWQPSNFPWLNNSRSEMVPYSPLIFLYQTQCLVQCQCSPETWRVEVSPFIALSFWPQLAPKKKLKPWMSCHTYWQNYILIWTQIYISDLLPWSLKHWRKSHKADGLSILTCQMRPGLPPCRGETYYASLVNLLSLSPKKYFKLLLSPKSHICLFLEGPCSLGAITGETSHPLSTKSTQTLHLPLRFLFFFLVTIAKGFLLLSLCSAFKVSSFIRNLVILIIQSPSLFWTQNLSSLL